METEITNNGNSFQEALKPYFKKWKYFLVSIFIALCLAVLYLKFTTPVYKIKATILIKDARKMSSVSGDINPLQGLAGFNGMSSNSIENEIEIFKSKKITQQVVDNLKLQIKLYKKDFYYDVLLYGNTAPFIVQVISEKETGKLPPPERFDIKINGSNIVISSKSLKSPLKTTFNKTISTPYANLMIVKNPDFQNGTSKSSDDFYFEYSTNREVVDDIQKGIIVDLLTKNSSIIGLETTGVNKNRAKDILNELVKMYNLDAVKDVNIESNKTKEFIDERISIISEELGDVESQKERFKVTNNIVDIPSEARLNLQMSVEAQGKYLDMESQSQINNILLNYLNKQDYTQVLPANVGLNNIAAAKNIEVYNSLVLQRNELLQNATTENPLVVDLTKQIAAMKSALKNNLEKNNVSIEVAKNQYSNQLSKFKTNIDSYPQKEKLFRSIERTQQIKENLYLLLLQKREESAIAMAMTADKARVVDDAYTERKKEAPNVILAILGAILLGIGLPLAAVYIRELFNNKINSKADIAKLTKTDIIAEIPRLQRNENELIATNDLSSMAEAFRILVTNLKYVLPKSTIGKTVFVTSTVKGEGKTFISMNLALSLASAHVKVIVIGSDIRNPQLQRYDPTMKNAKGLTEYLVGEIENPDDIIHKSNESNYCDILYSGSIPPNPASLLENGRYKELIDQLRSEYDYIILDTPPLMLVTDSLLIAENADATIYVTRSEVSEKEYLKFANNLISSNKLKKVSIVINDVHRANFGYGNKYGYGYQAKERTLWQKLFNKQIDY